VIAMRAFICSRDDTVTRLDGDDASTKAQSVLNGVPVGCVAADGDRVIVGTRGAGALLSSDGGRRWERATGHPLPRALELPPRPWTHHVRRPDRGASWQELAETAPIIAMALAAWTARRPHALPRELSAGRGA
jgi:hypothetical protein